MSSFTTLSYDVRDAKAYLTLNRPDRLNAIDDVMSGEIRAAVEQANADDGVRVIVVQGAGRAFCAGYDLKQFAEGDVGDCWRQGEHWDPIRDYREMRRNTDDFFTLWRSLKPTIAKVHGHAVAGGRRPCSTSCSPRRPLPGSTARQSNAGPLLAGSRRRPVAGDRNGRTGPKPP